MFEIQNLKFNPETNTLTIQLDPNLTEFALELGEQLDAHKKDTLRQFVRRTVRNMKGTHVKTVRVMVGSVLLTTLYFNPSEADAATDFNMGYLYYGSTSSQISFVDRTNGVINHTSPSYFDIHADGTLDTSNLSPTFINEMKKRGVKVVPFLSNHWNRDVGRAALANREVLAQQIADTIAKNDLDGVNVDIENVSDVESDNYTDLVRLLREKIPTDKEVSVAVAANPNGWTKGWHGSYDYKKLSDYSDYLMIMAYDESWEGSDPGPVASISFVESSIKYALTQGVPKEKIVLGLPHYGRVWMEGQTYGGTGITNQRVQELITKYQSTLTFDTVSQSPKATVTIKSSDPVYYINGKALKPGVYTIWYENEQSIKEKVNLVDKYGLKGTGNWALGQENTSLWGDFKTWIPSQTQIVAEQVTNGMVGLTTTNVNLRASASTTSSILKKIPSGASIEITGSMISDETYQWFPVKLSDGTTGFIASNYLKAIQANEMHGDNRYQTSVAISQKGWEDTSDYVVLGRGDNPIDALTGSVLAKKYHSPLLLTKTNSLPSEASKEIDRLQPKNVIILGGEAAISKVVEKSLENKGINVQRISGENRYATATKIAAEVGTSNEIILTTGENSPDPLSIAPYAGMKQIPIVLTKPNGLSPEVSEMVKSNGISKVTIIGGETAVSPEVEQQLKQLGVIVNRISGSNRYATSVEIAKTYQSEFNLDNVYFSSGVSYVDALSGSPLAAMQGAPIILLNKDTIPNTVSDWITNQVDTQHTTVNYLGGYQTITKNNRLNVFRQMQ
ncbi:cell wall-binding repeat-containing protein [Ornithinibacillus salinisoli]|uniref:Cell wall-binding repeat-containing protein n=1 Tax=Ornithinibacillus salinisoli TaxID=1848459 RepID=A0ABW4VXZ7_9BACI